MKPFGKTYLIKCEVENQIKECENIFLVNFIDKYNDIFWKGTVIGYGTAFTEEEKGQLVPIGKTVVMTYGKDTPDKGGIHICLGKNIYYIREKDEILGVLEDE